jgi:hypothetical protein
MEKLRCRILMVLGLLNILVSYTGLKVFQIQKLPGYIHGKRFEFKIVVLCL